MPKRAKTIDLLRMVDVLQAHITPALCRTVFGAVRTTERQRVWTLEALIRFWTAVVLRAPKALTQALADSVEGRDPVYPRVEASPEAFFQRCRDLRPAFFAEVFQRFTARLVTAVPPRYAAEVAPVRARFAAIVILDGSRLTAIAHRLKLLWNERAVVLPGCLLGVYDLGRGLCRQLLFSADAAASEMTRARAAVATLARDTLVLGDRLYGTAAFFAALGEQRCWGVVRRNRLLRLHKLQRLRQRRIHGGRLEDWLVQAGTGATAPRQLLRYIRWRRGGTRYEVLTNVLSPARLSARKRWTCIPTAGASSGCSSISRKCSISTACMPPIPMPSPCRSMPPRSSTTPCGWPRATAPPRSAGNRSGCRRPSFSPRSPPPPTCT